MAIHAYDQAETLLGQGTIGLELETDVGDIDTLLAAVSGGGLIGGIAAWYSGKVMIVAVESDGAPTLHSVLKAGGPVDAPTGSIAADSLAPTRIGTLTFTFARRHVAPDVVLVSDADHSKTRSRRSLARALRRSTQFRRSRRGNSGRAQPPA